MKLDQVRRLKLLEQENGRLQGSGRPDDREADLEGIRLGKLLSAARRWGVVTHVAAKLDVSESLTCRVLGQHRSTQRKAPKAAYDEAALRTAIIDLARQHGRYGHRRITALLRAEGWRANHKRVERIWRAVLPASSVRPM